MRRKEEEGGGGEEQRQSNQNENPPAAVVVNFSAFVHKLRMHNHKFWRRAMPKFFKFLLLLLRFFVSSHILESYSTPFSWWCCNSC